MPRRAAVPPSAPVDPTIAAGSRTLVRPRGAPSRIAGIRRGTLAGTLLLVAAGWFALVLGSALSEVHEVQRRAEALRATNAELAARLDAGRREIALIQTEPFLGFQARAYGMGEREERAFALEPGAPSPRPIVPLGAEPAPPSAPSPLDLWLELLFR